MRPLKRKPVNKHGFKHQHGSAKQFQAHTERTHPKNIKPMPMRGGWRL